MAEFNRANLMVKRSKISENGVFAKTNIKKGQSICFFKGERISLKEAVNRVNQGIERTATDTLQIGQEKYLDLDNFARSFNHSCDPNCFIRGQCELVALRDIKKGEELTYDYSTTMDDNYKYASRSLWTNKCNCGAKNCRRSIDQFRTLPKRIQNFYLKNRFVPDFILIKFGTQVS